MFFFTRVSPFDFDLSSRSKSKVDDQALWKGPWSSHSGCYITPVIKQRLSEPPPFSFPALVFQQARFRKQKIRYRPGNSVTYTPENQHDIGKSPLGNTSSNRGVFIVMFTTNRRRPENHRPQKVPLIYGR